MKTIFEQSVNKFIDFFLPEKDLNSSHSSSMHATIPPWQSEHECPESDLVI